MSNNDEAPLARPEKWIHLSDLHFGTETQAVLEALRAFVEIQDPEGLVVSGDVTQRARAHEFRAAGDFLRQLTADRCLLVVPGNHDLPLFRLWERVLSPYGLFTRTFGPLRSVSVRDVGIFRFILMNSTRARRHKVGTLDAGQVEEVEAELARAEEGRLRAVVLHHPLPAFDDAGGEFNGGYTSSSHAEEAVRRWARAGLDLVFCGHTHHPRVLRLTPTAPPRGLEPDPPGGTEPEFDRTPWMLQAGTSLSQRLRKEPNSLYVLLAQAAESGERNARPSLRLERWDFSSSTQKFERTSQTFLN